MRKSQTYRAHQLKQKAKAQPKQELVINPSPNEEWRPVPGFEGYKVSNLGGWRSRQRVSKGYISRLGYLKIHMYGAEYFLHRIVMLAFRGPSNLHVNHINGVKLDNRLCNLEYCTHAENMKHARDTGLMSRPSKRERSLFEQHGIDYDKLLKGMENNNG